MRAVNQAFKTQVEAIGNVAVVSVEGDVDLDTAEAFSEALRGAAGVGAGPVVVDLCGVPFMDSTGLHLLLNLLRRLTRQGRRMAVASGSSAVQRLFELTRLDGTFELYESRTDALAALDRGGRLGV